MAEKPKRKPWFMLVAVLRPMMALFSVTSSEMRGSLAVLAARALRAEKSPGQMRPPRYVLPLTQSKVVAVPKSMVMQGPP